ncbi:MAG: TolB family protein [Solirubrobacterales bacterium]
MPADAAFPGQNGKIAYSYVCSSVDDCGIFAANPDGSGATQLTHNTYKIVLHGDVKLHDLGPEWSADGRQLVYARETPSGYDIRVVNSDGSGDHSLGVAGFNPAWSPDGTKIAFQLDGIYVMNSDGTEVTQVRPSGAGPDWSPDGTRIAFYDAPSGSPIAEIYTMNPEGTNPVQITEGQVDSIASFFPSWSPDGTKIAFNSGVRGLPYEVFSMNADGSGQTNLTNNADASDERPAWSPDGSQIAFMRQEPHQQARSFAMAADGTGPHPVFDGSDPSWQPVPPPSTGKNRAKACKAERERLGDAQFTQKYGGGANAHGRCVSGR